MDYDLIIAGGGLAGSSLGRAMSSHGARVLVVERETEFRDRVRGEGLSPWGVPEALALGIKDLIIEGGGMELRWWRTRRAGESETKPRDLPATNPHGTSEIAFYHAAMQETLLRAAESAGVEVRRGVTVAGVDPGERPSVTLRVDGGGEETQSARLVVGADGRQSRVRRWAGFSVQQDPEMLVVGGVLFNGLNHPSDGVDFVLDPAIGQGVLVFPLKEDRYRVYFIYRKVGELRRLSGHRHVPDFIRACIETGASEEWFEGAEVAGPLAMFRGADTWVDHPYTRGVALVGDAAAATDPTWGCGMSLTLRDVRVLRDCLMNDNDWEQAARDYAAERDIYYGSLRRMTRWYTGTFFEVGPEGDARRARVLPKLAREPHRAPDGLGLGPDGPNDEENLADLS